MKIFKVTLICLILVISCKSSDHVSDSSSKETKEKEAASKEVTPDQESGDQKETEPEEIKRLHAKLSDTTFARIQRTACFGTCPIYVMTVYKSGLVKYYGEKWVDKKGTYYAKFDTQKLVELVEAAQKINYFQLDHVYDDLQVTDLPSTITTLTHKEGYKTVINRYMGPEELGNFENFFDDLFKDLDWKEARND